MKILTELRRLLPGIARPLAWTAFFSFFLNLLYLAAPLYMMQVYDRVMRSQSVPTLLYLTAAVAIAYITLAVLDGVRGQILCVISDIVEQQLVTVLLHQATAPAAATRVRPEVTVTSACASWPMHSAAFHRLHVIGRSMPPWAI